MKKTTVALLALTAASSAFAFDFSGFYAGGNVGYSSFHKTVKLQALENKEFNQTVTDEVEKDLHKGNGLSYGLQLGYHVNNWFSVELGFQHFAPNVYTFVKEEDVKKEVVETPNVEKTDKENTGVNKNDERVTEVEANRTFKQTREKRYHRANAIDLVGKFNYFFDSVNLNVYAGVGAAVVMNSIDQNFFDYNNSKEKVINNRRGAPVALAGLEYYFTPKISLGVEYKSYFNVFRATDNTEKKHAGVEVGYVTKTVDKKEGTFLVRNKANDYKPTITLVSANLNYHFGNTAPMPVVAPAVVSEKFVVRAETLFNTGKYELLSTAAEALSPVLAAYNQDANEAQVKVTGHADRRGGEEYNLRLSQNRAAAVGNYLVSQGVDSSRLMTEGVGTSQPVTDGCYDVKQAKLLNACLAPDRRVDVVVSGTKR